MLESLILVTILRLERNCTGPSYQSERERRLNGFGIVENTSINATVFHFVYYIVFVHAFYLHLLVIF